MYLVCFDRPFRHARHYLGYVSTAGRDPQEALESRLGYHRKGRGSRLLKAVTEAGIDWEVVRTWPEGSQTHERRLKGHSSTRLCPTCSGPAALGRGLDRTPTLA